MHNKKAIVFPEVLKILIAALCLFLLIYLAVSLYQIFITKSELEQARATLGDITGKINTLEEGKNSEYLITAPKNWIIISFRSEENNDNNNFLSELCICPSISAPGYEWLSYDKEYEQKDK